MQSKSATSICSRFKPVFGQGATYSSKGASLRGVFEYAQFEKDAEAYFSDSRKARRNKVNFIAGFVTFALLIIFFVAVYHSMK